MKYEYKVVNINVVFDSGKGCERKIQAICDELGMEGYELVNFQNYDAASKFMLIFKRPKDEG